MDVYTVEDARPRTLPLPTAADSRAERGAPEGLVFDVCSVLYDDTPWKRWLVQLAGRLGLHLSYERFHRDFEGRFGDAVNCGQQDYWEALAVYLRQQGLSRGQVDQLHAAAEPRQRAWCAELRPLPGVIPTLELLACQPVALGAVASAPWTTHELRSRLAQLGVASFLMASLSSLEVGPTGPNGLYAAAAASLRLAPGAVALVSSDARVLAAAAAAGLRTIAIQDEPDTVAELHLEQFEQLTELYVGTVPATSNPRREFKQAS